MITPEMLQTFPLTMLADGTIRVTGSRVPLETIVGQFKLGASPEHICESFPSLSLREVYGALFFYLDHEQEVEAYIQQQKQDGEEVRRLIENSPYAINRHGLRERLLARAAQMQANRESVTQ
jgi:uncharacterized protein (DUF433 family)